MKALRRFLHRVWATVSGARDDEELRDELTGHLEMLADDYIRQGMSTAEARRAAALRLGNVESTKESWRDASRLRLLETIARDVRHALRSLAGRPAFAASCVLTLALAISANITIFSLLDRVLLHPLDVPDPAQLVTFQHLSQVQGAQQPRMSMNLERAERLRGLSALASVALSSSRLDRASQRLVVSVDDGVADAIDVRFVTASFFGVLGIRPIAGRGFVSSDDTAAAPPVAVLSHRFWQTRFGGSREAIGRTVRVNGVPALVVGVVPRTFTGIELGVTPPELYLPLMTASRVATQVGSQTDGRGMFFTGSTGFVASPISPVSDLMVIGRVTPGAERQLQTELSALPGSETRTVVPLAETMIPFASRSDLQQFLGLLAGAAGLTLLIGCASLAGLLLARGEDRRAELSVRAALGAGRARLVREVVTEPVILALTGGVVALLAARWMDQALSVFVLPGNVSVASLRDAIDGRTLAFTLIATGAAAVMIGVAPAVRTANRRLTLDVEGHAGARLGVARVLVGVQVAVCVVLVFSAVLFVRTLSNALATDVGFDSHDLVSAIVSVPQGRPGPNSDVLASFHAIDRLVERARAIPGVDAVTAGPLPLLRGSDRTESEVRIDGVARPAPADVVYVSAEYFTTLKQTLLHGRDFDERDRAEGRPVAIVNDAAARQFWPDGDALEHQVGFARSGLKPADFAVVGIVRDAKLRSLRDPARPVVYLVRPQHEYYLAGYMAASGSSFLIARTAADLSGVTASLARAAAETGLSLQGVTTLDQVIDELLMPQRLGRALLMLLGAMALALTVAGIYGLAACLVARHIREIGIRIVLGAGRRDIAHSIVIRTLAPVLIGIAVGAGLAWYGGRFADRFMYEMRGSDPATIALAAALIATGGAIAVLRPVLRAQRTDPVVVLRAE